MSKQPHSNQDALPPAAAEHLDKLCDRFEAARKIARSTDQRPRIEDYLGVITFGSWPRNGRR